MQYVLYVCVYTKIQCRLFLKCDRLCRYGVTLNENIAVITNVTSIRGGIGATLGVIGSQLPYPYVHVIYWIVQIMLVALAVQTGVVLAVNIHFQQTGTASQTIVRLVERSSLLLCIEDNHFIADSGCFLCFRRQRLYSQRR